jgi:2-dehydropantoate 2-reductase
MKILCFGAGAIGGYVGTSLALEGHKVGFLERAHNIAKLQSNGFELETESGTKQLASPTLFSTVKEAMADGPYDFAILALKSYDTAEALDSLKGFEAQVPTILCLQNGVDNEALIADRLGQDRIIAGTVTTAVGKTGPGRLKLERKRGIGVGTDHELSEAIVEAMNQAGLNARLYSNSASMKWSKLLTNLLANAQCAILDMNPSAIFSEMKTYDIEVKIQREALQVMRKLKLPVVDLPGTPVRALAIGMGKLPNRISQPLVLKFAGAGRGDKMPSLHIDRFGGRQKSEVEWLNGAVVRWGQKVGVEAPANLDMRDKLEELIGVG